MAIAIRLYANFPQIDGAPPSEEIARCFQRLTRVLLSFASDHSLVVRKYYQNQPWWSFHFRHPAGGFGSIQVQALPGSEGSFRVEIYAHWWVDDQEALTRQAVSIQAASFETSNEEVVAAALNKALKDILEQGQSNLSRSSVIMPRRRDAEGRLIYSEFEGAQTVPT